MAARFPELRESDLIVNKKQKKQQKLKEKPTRISLIFLGNLKEGELDEDRLVSLKAKLFLSFYLLQKEIKVCGSKSPKVI